MSRGTVYIKDANILIDLAKADILQEWFSLKYITITSDLVIHEIKDPIQRERVDYWILEGNLVVKTLDFDGLIYCQNRAELWRVSLPDVSVFLLAQNNGGILLTGDRRLKNKAEENEVPVKGILWVLDELYEQGLITGERAWTSLEALNDPISRLPEDESKKRRIRWKREP